MDTSNFHILYVLFLFSLEKVFIIIPFQFYIFHFIIFVLMLQYTKKSLMIAKGKTTAVNTMAEQNKQDCQQYTKHYIEN